jgi:hypothetical protein
MSGNGALIGCLTSQTEPVLTVADFQLDLGAIVSIGLRDKRRGRALVLECFDLCAGHHRPAL